MSHGTAAYRRGCRCSECREAHRVAEMNRRRRNGIQPPSLVPIGIRMDMKTEKSDEGCWLWNGSLDQHGYGMIKAESGRTARAHRVMWELEVGPIPEGMTIDHLCLVKNCVFPGHMEIVSRAENSRRIRALEKQRRHAA